MMHLYTLVTPMRGVKITPSDRAFCLFSYTGTGAERGDGADKVCNGSASLFGLFALKVANLT